jgi:hypothetical protein
MDISAEMTLPSSPESCVPAAPAVVALSPALPVFEALPPFPAFAALPPFPLVPTLPVFAVFPAATPPP